MKSICILCESSKLTEANALAKIITGSEILKTPLSPKGEAPATHYFTYIKTTDEGYERLLGLQSLCTIEESGLKVFLKKQKLEVVVTEEPKETEQ
jgi:hypothetical protein